MYLKEIKIEKEEETQQGDFETLGVSGKRRPSSPSPERPGDVTHFPSAREFGGRVLVGRKYPRGSGLALYPETVS